MERRDAIANALKTALPSIFTSGLILITAGLVVHFVSSEIAISQVGLLLGQRHNCIGADDTAGTAVTAGAAG